MLILPAIDMYQGKAVRLLKGDYDRMTVYDTNPVNVACQFKAAGAEWIHLVDLEGARDGDTPNSPLVRAIVQATGLKVEIGGGIRSLYRIEHYVAMGVSRVILGTSAITDQAFLLEAVKSYGDKIAVGADVKDGKVAIKGWRETTPHTLFAFCEKMQGMGVKTMICTDISKDGALEGTNREMYQQLRQQFAMEFIASGGVSTLDDIRALKALGMHGAIIGKAYYTGAIDLAKAIEEAK